MRYMIQFIINGVVRRRQFKTSAEAGRFGQAVRNISGVTEVSRVIEVP